MTRTVLNVFFPLAIGAILFLMAKEAFNSSMPLAIPASVVLGLMSIFAVLYAMAESK